MHSAISSHRENNAKKFDAVSKRIDSIQANVSDNKKNVGSCLAEMIQLQKRLNMLEDRSRIYDVWLVNLPSEAEGEDPKGRRCCQMDPIAQGDARHCCGGRQVHQIFSNNTSRPQNMIFKLLPFSDRQTIPEGARRTKPSLLDGTQLLFFANYGAGATEERQEHKEIRAALRQKGKVR